MQQDPENSEASAGGKGSGRRSDDIYRVIADSIDTGAIEPGARLPSEATLAETHSVSRPTVREALARLREDGLIISRQGSGAYVQQASERIKRIEPLASIADLQNCFRYRVGLESEAARVAAERRSASDLKGLRFAYEAMNVENARKRIGMEEDFAFHMSVARASGNRFFVAGLEQVRAHIAQGMTINRTLSLESKTPRVSKVQIEHLAIVDAIEAGDPDAAAEAMATHLRCALNRLFEG